MFIFILNSEIFQGNTVRERERESEKELHKNKRKAIK